MRSIDYSAVTEQVGDLISQEALSMVYSRYRFAAQFCAGKRVLEVACGPGIGLGYLAKHATLVVGGDYTKSLLERARVSSKTRLDLLRMDAHALPFDRGSLDLVVCYEALYYFAQPEQFLSECRRVLSRDGVLLLSSVNPEWTEFNPSPHSCWYFGATDLDRVLRDHGFTPRLYGAFPATNHTMGDHMVSWMKRMAVRFRLIPSTMKGKQWLKRLFLGRLIAVPAILHDGIAAYDAPVPVEIGRSVKNFKIIFAVARLT